jgi:hypothetical protein
MRTEEYCKVHVLKKALEKIDENNTATVPFWDVVVL